MENGILGNYVEFINLCISNKCHETQSKIFLHLMYKIFQILLVSGKHFLSQVYYSQQLLTKPSLVFQRYIHHTMFLKFLDSPSTSKCTAKPRQFSLLVRGHVYFSANTISGLLKVINYFPKEFTGWISVSTSLKVDRKSVV